VKNNTKFKDI